MLRVRVDRGWAFPDRREVRRVEHSESLTDKEAALLAYLARAAPRPVPVAELLAKVWGVQPTLNTHTVATTIHTLRRKVEVNPKQPQILQTVRGAGYRYVAPLEQPPSLLERMLHRDPPAARRALAATLDLERAPVEAAEWSIRLAGTCQRAGDIPGAIRWMNCASEALRRLDGASPELTARLAMVEGLVIWRQGRSDAAIPLMRARRGLENEAPAGVFASFNSQIVEGKRAVLRSVPSLAEETAALGRLREASVMAAALACAHQVMGASEAAHAWAVRGSRWAQGHPRERHVLGLWIAVSSGVREAAVAALSQGTTADPRADEPFGWAAEAWAAELAGRRVAKVRAIALERLRRQPCPYTHQAVAALGT